ncbi:hypothetical protein DACRYDRAFT_18943 [Dacryopinax primogenitus]|uniref:Clathrin light chain n=1 Tax=Dacryopinax primogenitus (strain DJM 731) TaxID=1858805 RepID=M5FUE1_DACPD|nr:uncharacterized protein DACRYDRAFT_18943 [Dacryopinax primogenitus]EJT96851.1 hypothetical protein DACRYDRAFT_18943 [Dacryopinax primogenitus]
MDIDHELDRANSAFPDITDDFDPTQLTGTISSVPPPPAVDDFGWGFDAPSAPPAAVKITRDDEVEKFENQFPELDDTPSFQPMAPAQPTLRPSFLGGAPVAAPSAPAMSLSPAPGLFSQDEDEEEREVIKQWREKQAEQIREREDKAARRKADTIKKAEESIDQFYEDYNKQKERNIRENKFGLPVSLPENEAQYLDGLNASLSEGTTWSRICSLIELENSQSKTLARAGPGTTDLSRYKEVLLRLRREGDRAPGAAGY